MIDQTFAHFRITAKLGEGGMGTVYRSEDTKLGREVALKFLPEAFAADAERLARFTREAQALASLNHPNIAGIHSVEEATPEGSTVPVVFLVMELVEGETLQERIAKGPLGVDEALKIALQIANGLEEAHERGIIHRDLKPANIKLTPARQVKILDFGLAKAFDPDAPGDSLPSGQPAQRLSLSPTMTGLATQAGILLGTAAYMSPEQARGESVDRRSDVWAFGVVFMEMLTGRVVHQGKTLSDTLASVLAREPDWDSLPADLPRPVRRLLDRCLQKESRERMRDIGEARIAIEHFLAHPETAVEERADTGASTVAVPLWQRAMPWAVTGLFALGLIATWMVLGSATGPSSAPMRVNLSLPADQMLFTGYGASTVLSPDGSRLAYVLGLGNEHRIEIRQLDQWQGTLVVEGQGADRPYQPFFSPDGTWLGFNSTTEMRKVPVTGGTSIKLCDISRARGASWGEDGTIAFAPDPGSGLMRVSENGGEPTVLTELDAASGELSHRWPQWLPGGKSVLFTSYRTGMDDQSGHVEIVDAESGQRTVVHRGGSYGRYLETGSGAGFILYTHSGSLFAIPYDRKKLQATGSASPVIEGVTFGSNEGSAQFSTSANGTLAYASGDAGTAGQIAMVRLGHEGDTEPLWPEHQVFSNPRYSPDGVDLAVQVASEGQADIWIYNAERGVPTRLTFSESDDLSPVWSPDGEYVYYAAEVDDKYVIKRKLADGTGDAELIYASERNVSPESVSPDGTQLVFVEMVVANNIDIGILPLAEPDEPRMLLNSKFIEIAPRISPNGRWLAYCSEESGTFEIYVRALDGRGKWQISSGGGFWPMWAPDGSKLYFLNGRALRVADVDLDQATFRAGRSRVLLETDFANTGIDSPIDISADGLHFVTFQDKGADSSDTHRHVELVLNWADELRARFGK